MVVLAVLVYMPGDGDSDGDGAFNASIKSKLKVCVFVERASPSVAPY